MSLRVLWGMNCALQIGWPVAEGWVTCPVTSEWGCAEQHSDQAWWVRAPFHVFGASCFPESGIQEL